MKISEIVEWITTEFKPLELSVDAGTINQFVQNAIRYFNNNSAVKYIEMVTITGNRTKVSKYIKAVSQVYPSSVQNLSGAYELPMWTLLGVQVLNALNTDLIMLSETYKSMSVYMGKDFQWTFVPSEDANDTNGGGYLYTNNNPSQADALAVVGARRVFVDEDITEGFTLDWILRYSKALVKVAEGNVLRKGAMINVPTDGGDMISEAKDEIKDLQEELYNNGRWLVYGGRI